MEYHKHLFYCKIFLGIHKLCLCHKPLDLVEWWNFSKLMISSVFIGLRSRGSQFGMLGSSFRKGFDIRSPETREEFDFVVSILVGWDWVHACTRGRNKRRNQIFFIFYTFVMGKVLWYYQYYWFFQGICIW